MRIVITGPESSGKTALAIALSQYYKGRMIPEYARYYLNPLHPEYSLEDVLYIAKMQYEASKTDHNKALSFEDTDLLTIFIWIEFKYGFKDQSIWDRLKTNLPEAYLYCEPDLDWTPDPLRENQNEREFIGTLYLQYLKSLNVKYFIIQGKARSRVNLARFYMNLLLK